MFLQKDFYSPPLLTLIYCLRHIHAICRQVFGLVIDLTKVPLLLLLLFLFLFLFLETAYRGQSNCWVLIDETVY